MIQLRAAGIAQQRASAGRDRDDRFHGPSATPADERNGDAAIVVVQDDDIAPGLSLSSLRRSHSSIRRTPQFNGVRVLDRVGPRTSYRDIAVVRVLDRNRSQTFRLRPL
ncbi:MAG: hypothetical protein ACTHQQ_04950 [Solirubrobacteraceae bacterium]